ncbi:hypothetical protein Tco_1398800, partial [Tanacetum coccineum]
IRRSGRRPKKEVVVEPDNDDKYIDVNDELSDDDLSLHGGIQFICGGDLGEISGHGCLGFRVFLPVDNEGHRFLLAFGLKYGVVIVFDQKKKDKIVFLLVDNEGHRFLLSFDLKYGAVILFDQKKEKIVKKCTLKKRSKIGNSTVAKMLHADFGRYLYGLNHIKSGNMIKAELEIREYAWQTATVRPYACFFNENHGNIHGEGNS